MKIKEFFKDSMNVILAILLTGGFMSVFSNIFHENVINVFVLITLPLLIGSLLSNNKKFEKESNLLLFSSIFLIVGFFLMFGTKDMVSNYVSIGFINFGAFIFSFGLLLIWEKVGNEIVEESLK